MKIDKRIRTIAVTFALALLPVAAQAVPSGFQEEVVLSGRSQPVYLVVLPDGRMLLAQKTGLISIFDPTSQPATTQTYLQITNIQSGQERGLTSIALDPNFANNGYLYVYYTHNSSQRNRISRFTHQGNSASLGSELMIWQDNENYSDCCHYGGGIGFGPDGKLYLTTGEEFDGAQSQALNRAGGKIIRINKDGTIPADNPFVDGPGGNLDEIWAYGLRNPFRASWDMPTGRFYIGDVGGNVQATAREEINIGKRGANYGWPNCEGQCASDSSVEKPIFDYGHTASTPAGGAVAAGFVYRGSLFPANYNERFFYADYARSFIRTLVLNPNGTVASDNAFHTNMGAPVHLVQGPDDAMYVVDFGTGGPDGRVLRYTYSSGNQPPAISSVTATPSQGQVPLTVNFNVTASDPEGSPLSYRWVFGDGTPDSTTRNPSHTYTTSGQYNAFVEVSDGSRSVFSDNLLIQAGNAPVVMITTPNDGATFRAGNTINFSGTASDPDETIPASNYSWDIRFFHNAHIHPAVTNYIGSSGTLQVETTGHDWHDDTGYEFELTVTDSDGLSSSDTIRIYPDKVDITLNSSPAGIPVFVDGIAQDTPIAYDTLIGFRHELSAPASYCLNGSRYLFASWSNGGAATQTYTVPTSNQTLTASYTTGGACQPIPQNGLVFHVEADFGVSTVGATNEVATWSDQSGQGNHLTATGNPQLVPGGLNGEDVIAFDGVGDTLERLTSVAGLPSGNADRTMYSVVRFDSTGYGGVAYGAAATNQAFGLIVAPNGNLMVQGWGNSNDFNSGVAGTGMGWMVQSAVHQGGQLRHYQDGVQIDSVGHSYATSPTSIVLGAEIDRNPFLDMDVAAVLIYDRALTAAEQSQVNAYFDVKYFGGVNVDILSPTAGQMVSSGNVPVTYVAAGDAFDHVHLRLDGGSIVELTNASGTHVFSNVSAGNHSVVATLVNATHQAVNLNNSQETVNFSAGDCFPDNFAPNCTVDTDGDGAPDSAEGPTADTDGDGTPNYLESSIEDADGDGTPDEVDSDDADVCIPSSFTPNCTLDSDGDGKLDRDEGETTDSDGDGTPDYLESSIADADGDGTVDELDRANTNACIPNGSAPNCVQPKSGGGSVGIPWLMALAGLLALRRRRYNHAQRVS